MFSVFSANHLTEIGKTIVRKHLATTDDQAVWQELGDHMRTSSKGVSEKRRLTHYVTNTVLDDSFKGMMIQFPPKMVENWWRYGGEFVTK